MHASSLTADKAPMVLRPDTADKARSPDPSGASDKDAASFDTVFQASSNCSDQSGTVRVATLPDPENTTGAEPEAGSGEEGLPAADDAADDTVIARAPEPDAPRHAETKLDDTLDHPVEEALRSSQEDGPDVGPRPDQPGPAPLYAGKVSGQVAPVQVAPGQVAPSQMAPGQAAPRRGDGPARAEATKADHMASPAQFKAVEAPASQKPDRADAAARIIQMRFMPGIAEPWGEGKADSAPRAEMRTIRGPDDARLPGPSGMSMPVTTGPSPAMHGLGAGAAQSRPELSSVLAAAARGAGADRPGDPDAPLGIDARGSTGSSLASSTLTALPRNDLPHNMAMQIAAAIQKGGPGMKSGIELRLSPEELGIVRLTFTQSEAGVTVNIHAERAETLELLRRNIDTLAQEFLDIGYDTAEFTFDREETGAQDTARPADAIETGAALHIAGNDAEARNQTVVISDRLDIRL
jgi:hypothetical protein